MSEHSLPYDISATHADERRGLELRADGERLATAFVSEAAQDALKDQLGLGDDAILAILRQALTDELRGKLGVVSVAPPRELPDHPLCFQSYYLYRANAQIELGWVWYDVSEATTGPDACPAIVRNHMRTQVHRALTSAGSAARALLDLQG